MVVVSHNYEQVKEYATRKVRLFDGEVVEDKVITPREDVKEGITLAGYYMSIWNLLALSVRNLIRTPRRTIFTIFVAIFISMAFVLSFGSYMKSINQPYYYGGGYFQNVTERRIIVSKYDGTTFSEDDINNLKQLDGVLGVLNHDILLDETVKSYSIEYGYLDYREYYMNPVSAILPSELIEGRFPENEYEVIVEDNSNNFTLGDMLTLTIGNNNVYMFDGTTTLSDIDGITVEVVGKIKELNPNSWQGRMYFHDDFLYRDDVLIYSYLGSGWSNVSRMEYSIVTDEGQMPIDFWGEIVLDETIPVGEVKIGYDILYQIADQIGVSFEDNPTYYEGTSLQIDSNTNFYKKTQSLSVTGEYLPAGVLSNDKGSYSYSCAANPNSLLTLVPTELYQVTVFVRDSFDAKTVVPAIKDLGFNAIYPASVQNQFAEISRIFSTLGFTILMVFLMTIVFWVTYAVLRNVQSAKKKDYLIFRSIGASKKDLYKVTNLELMIAFFMSLLIVIIFFIINELHQIWVFPQYLRYFNVFSYLALLLILMTLALLLGRKFNRTIFDKSVITALRQE